MPRARPVTVTLPAEMARHDGLAYSLWLPPAGAPVRGGVVILHGAGSCKESHHDFARVLVAAGLAAVAFDQRGHGESPGRLDGRALEDVAAIAELLRSRVGDPALPLVTRGSSMGGYLALTAAPRLGAVAVVAICPPSAEQLRRGLRNGSLEFEADVAGLEDLLARHPLEQAMQALEVPVLLLHAEGDERVPVEHSRELAAQARSPESRLIAVPGGHHRSVQHDPELQAASLRFIERAVGAR